jgi:hypothetical protein
MSVSEPFPCNQINGGGNTAIGYQALRDNLSGSNNVAIGAYANVGSPGLTSATAIGAGSRVDRSNSIVLGSVGATFTNVGVGTSTPLHALHISPGSSGATGNVNAHLVIEVNAAAYQHFLTPAANESGIFYGNPTGSIRGGIIFNSLSNADGIQFRTGGNSSRVTIDNLGNVGVGTTAPVEKLHVSGAGD